MNKTILIAGGTAVVSLAVGAAGGYFIAKKRFDDGLPEIIDNETKAIKKHYSVMLMEAKSGKPDSPADIPRREDVAEEGEELEEEELSEADQAVYNKAQKAMTDYQGISTKIVSDSGSKTKIEHRNVFTSASGKNIRPMPPRGPGGKFRPKTSREAENDPPQIIDEEAFLLNDPDNDQESLLYFINDKTLVLAADSTAAVDIAKVGEVNLTLFPEVPEGVPSMIYVRDMGMGTDYEVKRMDESLTSYIGLGENSDGEDMNESAWV